MPKLDHLKTLFILQPTSTAGFCGSCLAKYVVFHIKLKQVCSDARHSSKFNLLFCSIQTQINVLSIEQMDVGKLLKLLSYNMIDGRISLTKHNNNILGSFKNIYRRKRRHISLLSVRIIAIHSGSSRGKSKVFEDSIYTTMLHFVNLWAEDTCNWYLTMIIAGLIPTIMKQAHPTMTLTTLQNTNSFVVFKCFI